MKVRIIENIYLSNGSCIPESALMDFPGDLECHKVNGNYVPILYAAKDTVGEWDEDECCVFTDNGGEHYIPEEYTETL